MDSISNVWAHTHTTPILNNKIIILELVRQTHAQWKQTNFRNLILMIWCWKCLFHESSWPTDRWQLDVNSVFGYRQKSTIQCDSNDNPKIWCVTKSNNNKEQNRNNGSFCLLHGFYFHFTHLKFVCFIYMCSVCLQGWLYVLVAVYECDRVNNDVNATNLCYPLETSGRWNVDTARTTEWERERESEQPIQSKQKVICADVVYQSCSCCTLLLLQCINR